jgi:predicted GNAT family acetyltransferase
VAGEVQDNAALSRFELTVDGETAVLDYVLSPGVATLTHTGVPPALEGRGVGTALVRGALEAIRARGLKIVVRCWFVDAFIARHPEFGDLRA